MAKEDYEQRGQWSKQMTDLIGQTVRQYPSDVAHSFKQAGKELSDYETTGVSLATLRSLRWVLQGLLWDAMDAIVEPVGISRCGRRPTDIIRMDRMTSNESR